MQLNRDTALLMRSPGDCEKHLSATDAKFWDYRHEIDLTNFRRVPKFQILTKIGVCVIIVGLSYAAAYTLRQFGAIAPTEVSPILNMKDDVTSRDYAKLTAVVDASPMNKFDSAVTMIPAQTVVPYTGPAYLAAEKYSSLHPAKKSPRPPTGSHSENSDGCGSKCATKFTSSPASRGSKHGNSNEISPIGIEYTESSKPVRKSQNLLERTFEAPWLAVETINGIINSITDFR